MGNANRVTQRLGHPRVAASFLDRVRSRCPNAELLQIFDNCRVGYQAALIALLISEELWGTPKAGSGPNDHGAGKDRNGSHYS